MINFLNEINAIDATIIAAAITLIGTIYSVQSNKSSKKQDLIVETNKQLLELLDKSNKEIAKLKDQYAEETERLERKIQELTKENSELRKEVTKLNNYMIKLGISI